MSKHRNKLWYLVFVLPLFIIFATVVLIPFVIGIFYSFFEWDGFSANPMVYVGLDNYIELIDDGRFVNSAWLTLEFTILSLVLVNVLGLGFALLVTSAFKSANFARTMFFMPNLIGGLILGYIWQFIFSDGFRIIGDLTGNEEVFRNWLTDRDLAMYALVIVFSWQMAGYMMIIYIAGIQSIPGEVMEAAEIDGANYWQRLKNIVMPLLMPALTISLFLTLSFSFKIYDVNLSLTSGGPANSTELLAMHIYNEIFGYNNYGYGQAKAIIFFIVIAAITLVQVYMTKKREVEM
ncbi:raffinose/stachyose/melibiose transport system permease protein [Alkalibacillus filiformis]|uniref:Raffinose/stachyose/melibiose transport system permease protein n=1 Tax=Alkalibacillus filiformis TaxID=200990 RepID=A0ABU0DV63_9BACI|nr:sugar ABC transporter permease [Alkalibacillus filiformis]MDQ0352339.1 raffinose/stachyose/melibiose transport system permease protein [Alkalibacillus filiformis]